MMKAVLSVTDDVTIGKYKTIEQALDAAGFKNNCESYILFSKEEAEIKPATENLRALDALKFDEPTAKLMNELKTFSANSTDDQLFNEVSFVMSLRLVLLACGKLADILFAVGPENVAQISQDNAKALRDARGPLRSFAEYTQRLGSGEEGPSTLKGLFRAGGFMHFSWLEGRLQAFEMTHSVLRQADVIFGTFREHWNGTVEKTVEELEPLCPDGFDAAVRSGKFLSNPTAQKALLKNPNYSRIGPKCCELQRHLNQVKVVHSASAHKSLPLVNPEVLLKAQQMHAMGCNAVAYTFALHKLAFVFVEIKNVKARAVAVKKMLHDLSAKNQELSPEFAEAFEKLVTAEGFDEVKEMLQAIREAAQPDSD